MAEPSPKKMPVKLMVIASVICIVALVLCIMFVDFKGLHDKVAQVNGWLLFAMMTILPLVGVPVSFLCVAAGVKFGPVWGLVLAAAAILLHLLGSYWIGNSILRKPLNWLFKRVGYPKPQIPEHHAIPICALIALVPGLPYVIKNYMMVLGDVKLGPLILACWPTHFISVTLAVLFGGFSGEMTWGKGIFLVCYLILVMGLTRVVYRRLRRKSDIDLTKHKPAESSVETAG
jgi:uncharacterized membrane protein YdjX (TVP38/TMEM64 family)